MCTVNTVKIRFSLCPLSFTPKHCRHALMKSSLVYRKKFSEFSARLTSARDYHLTYIFSIFSLLSSRINQSTAIIYILNYTSVLLHALNWFVYFYITRTQHSVMLLFDMLLVCPHKSNKLEYFISTRRWIFKISDEPHNVSHTVVVTQSI